MMHEQNLMDLYEAVYQLAVKDDYKAVCHGIVERLQANRVPELQALRFVKSEQHRIKWQVRKDVFEEAQSYGNNTKAIQKKHINRLVSELVAEGVDKWEEQKSRLRTL